MLSSVYHTGCTGCASEEQLFHTLFAHYNRFIRPVENVSEPVTVHFELAITQLANVVSASDSRRVAREDTRGCQSPVQTLDTLPGDCIPSACALCAPDGPGTLSHNLKVNIG